MRTFKLCIKNLVYVTYGFLSAFYTPTFLLVSFNFMHGIANNADGEVLMPFGAFVLLTILSIDLFIIVRTLLSKRMSKFEKIFTISLFIIAKTAGTLVLENNDWRFFLECLQWKFTQQ